MMKIKGSGCKVISKDIFLFYFALFLKSAYYNSNITDGYGFIFFNIISFAGVALVLTSFAHLFESKTRLKYMIFINILLTIITMGDLLFYRHFKSIVNIRSFPVAAKYLLEESSIISLFRLSDIVLIGDFLVFGLFRLKSITITNRISQSFRRRIINFALLFVLGILGIGISIQRLDIMQPGIRSYLYSKVYITQVIGNINFHIVDILRDVKLRIDEAKFDQYPLSEIELWYKNKNKDIDKNNAMFGLGKNKNLIIIQVESLSEFIINSKINGQEITPNLNKFIKDSIYFNNFYSEVGNGGTSDAEFTVNVSLYPISKGAAFSDHASKEYYSLSNILKKNGYDTAAMEADQPGFWNIDMMYRTLGFDAIFDEDDYYHDEDIGMGLGDSSFFKQSMYKLKSMKQPFYAFMVTLSSHGPFIIPEKYRSQINVSPFKDTTFGRYIESIHYTDAALGSFLEDLKTWGFMDNSVIVIYGDHQVPIEKDNIELIKFLGYEKEIDEFNWLKLQKVPFIIHYPGNIPQINNIASGHVDIMPTVLNIMGIDIKKLPLMGRDILNDKKGFAISRNGYFVDDNFIYNVWGSVVYDVNNGKKYKLFDYNDKVMLYKQYIDYTDIIIKNNWMRKIKID